MGIRFCPRSAGFFKNRFSTTVFTDTEVCDAIQCIATNSNFFRTLLAAQSPACATVEGGPCPGDTVVLEECATFIRGLLTQKGAKDALTTFCGAGFLPILNSILRQTLANLLNICISTVTRFGCVGGVLPEFRVNLTDAQRAALGFAPGQCVTVADILALAESALSSCGAVSFDLDTLATVLRDMAQDAGTTIISPTFC